MNVIFNLLRQRFLSHKLLAFVFARRKLPSAMVIMMAFLNFCGYCCTANPAPHQPLKNKIFCIFTLWLAALAHYYLHSVKKFLGNNGFMFAFKVFSPIGEEPVVEGISEYLLALTYPQLIPHLGGKAEGVHSIG
ncbi:MAG: hypothetical protein WC572_00500 [Candidatus Omnitrophota bacterium]|nr:hypothetical protein [Candidatus Omnitrophota bacterium]